MVYLGLFLMFQVLRTGLYMFCVDEKHEFN